MQLSAPLYRLKRQAKISARTEGLSLAQALDAVARREGAKSWSHLSAILSETPPARRLWSRVEPGQLIAIAGRPGHGKTTLALELAMHGLRAGRSAVVFSLDFTEAALWDHIEALGGDPAHPGLRVDTSEDLDAARIMARPEAAVTGAILVVDYLQLLDQRRDSPVLDSQLRDLAAFARARQVTVLTVAQIRRDFEASGRDMPGWQDLRSPNPFDTAHFAWGCFLHEGNLRLLSTT